MGNHAGPLILHGIGEFGIAVGLANVVKIGWALSVKVQYNKIEAGISHYDV